MAMNMTILWLILFVACVVLEIVSMGLTTIWFAGGALVATVASMFGLPVWLQVVLFLAVSLILLFSTRPIAVKYFNKDRVKTNVESMIGKQAIVISEIDNRQGIGQVTVGGMEWTARSKQENKVIPVGAVVIVKEVSGVKLLVDEKPIA